MVWSVWLTHPHVGDYVGCYLGAELLPLDNEASVFPRVRIAIAMVRSPPALSNVADLSPAGDLGRGAVDPWCGR